MKKILFVVMAAVALMACSSEEGNGAGAPAGEKKALNAGTSQMVSQLGNKQATVEKSLISAGYVKMAEGSIFNPFADLEEKAPARRNAKAPKAVKSSEEEGVYFVYGLPENYAEMDEAQAAAYINAILKEGESFIVVAAYFNDEARLYATAATYITPISDNVNKKYIANSNALYKKLSAHKYKYWYGMVADDFDSEGDEYESHSAYTNRVAAKSVVYAQESGYSGNMYGEGFYYAAAYVRPNDADMAELFSNGITVPCAMCAVSVAELNGYGDY